METIKKIYEFSYMKRFKIETLSIYEFYKNFNNNLVFFRLFEFFLNFFRMEREMKGNFPDCTAFDFGFF